MQHDSLRIETYTISGDHTLLDKQNHITGEVRHILKEIRPDVEKGRKYLIKKLNKLCLKYPRVPVFKNLLSNVYQQNGNSEQAYAVNKWLVKEHPDYLFGKLNLAAQLLLEDEPKKIPEILGETMEIGVLYPHRKEFHVEEVISFNNICVQFFLAMDQIDHAETRIKVMEDIDGEHSKTVYARQMLQAWYLSRAYERVEREKKLTRNVVVKTSRSQLQTTEVPKFHFPEQVSWLYENDLSIDHEKIQQILQLDSQKLIEDLEKMLQDSIARFDYFCEEVENKGYENKKLDFPIHGLMLLAELKNRDSLNPILRLLKQDEDFNSLWMGNFMPQVMENALYHCGRDQTPLLFEFLKLPNVYHMNKASVGEALVKIIADSNEEKEVFVEQYRRVLKFFIENATDENYADTDAIGFTISDLIDLGYEELLPEIKKLYDLEIVGYWICGTYEEVRDDITRQSFGPSLKFIKKDIFEKYDELSRYEEEAAISPEEDEAFADDDFSEMYNQERLNMALLDEDPNEPTQKPKKIGRNEPCPCGSGKKYKKCCLDNN